LSATLEGRLEFNHPWFGGHAMKRYRSDDDSEPDSEEKHADFEV
jgi:hypothetical protein